MLGGHPRFLSHLGLCRLTVWVLGEDLTLLYELGNSPDLHPFQRESDSFNDTLEDLKLISVSKTASKEVQ